MKIKSIHVSNYRAFLNHNDEEMDRYKIELPEGENLLIYGENGSGKSSLYRALKDVFVSGRINGHTFTRNLFFSQENVSDPPCIRIQLDDDQEFFFSSDENLTNTTDSQVIKEAGILSGFISYRDLLKLHFRENSEVPDFFSFFLGKNGLFNNFEIPAPRKPANKISVGQLWQRILNEMDSADIDDYNINLESIFESLQRNANLLLSRFHGECNISINYNDCSVEKGRLIYPEISFDISFFGRSISNHHEFLNEARLTSMAISVYLAHLLNLPPSAIRILFLDDIFIGLDMSNRLPLIDILLAGDLGAGMSFKDFQIFLTTYDREWFGIAKSYLKKGWKHVEFYVDNHNQQPDRPFIRKSDSYKDRAHFHFIRCDYPASANYLRKEFERILRSILPDNLLYPGAEGRNIDNGAIIMAKSSFDMSQNDDVWFFKSKDPQTGMLSNPLRFVNLQSLINQFQSLVNQYRIPFPYLNELSAVKNRLLNPLSHDDLTSSVFKKELMTAFVILEEIEKIKSKIIFSIEGLEAIQLFCKIENRFNQYYCYRFEVLDNIRYFQYGNFRMLFNARCRSLYKIAEYGKIEIMQFDYTTIRKLCDSIIHDCGKASKSDEDFIFENVFTEHGEKLLSIL